MKNKILKTMLGSLGTLTILAPIPALSSCFPSKEDKTIRLTFEGNNCTLYGPSVNREIKSGTRFGEITPPKVNITAGYTWDKQWYCNGEPLTAKSVLRNDSVISANCVEDSTKHITSLQKSSLLTFWSNKGTFDLLFETTETINPNDLTIEAHKIVENDPINFPEITFEIYGKKILVHVWYDAFFGKGFGTDPYQFYLTFKCESPFFKEDSEIFDAKNMVAYTNILTDEDHTLRPDTKSTADFKICNTCAVIAKGDKVRVYMVTDEVNPDILFNKDDIDGTTEINWIKSKFYYETPALTPQKPYLESKYLLFCYQNGTQSFPITFKCGSECWTNYKRAMITNPYDETGWNVEFLNPLHAGDKVEISIKDLRYKETQFNGVEFKNLKHEITSDTYSVNFSLGLKDWIGYNGGLINFNIDVKVTKADGAEYNYPISGFQVCFKGSKPDFNVLSDQLATNKYFSENEYKSFDVTYDIPNMNELIKIMTKLSLPYEVGINKVSCDKEWKYEASVVSATPLEDNDTLRIVVNFKTEQPEFIGSTLSGKYTLSLNHSDKKPIAKYNRITDAFDINVEMYK